MSHELQSLYHDIQKEMRDLEHEIAFHDWEAILNKAGDIQVILNHVEKIAKEKLRRDS